MRGELPLPEGAAPWTPYIALTPSRGVSTGNGDGLSATCEPVPKRGWERRFEHSIMVMDRAGNLVDEWPHLDKLFGQLPCGRGPHQIKISPYDSEKHVWIIDDQLHMIYRFTYDGKLVHSKGQLGVRGRGPNTFDRPTDIAWLPDGTYFITDGYGGTRVAKYDAKDTFINDWGQPPADPKNPGPNEFNTVHSIAISADRRLFVVDRGHQRMQVFDENGTFLDMWPLRSPHWPANQGTLMVNHFLDQKGFIWVGDATTNRILKFDQKGNYLYSWGAPGPQPGRLGCSHGMTTDQLGNLYVADCFNGRLQKFEPIPGADPEKIAGQLLRTWDTWKAQ
jgi:DNA-binding beta-propeller fold protein YncE